jgi:N-acetylmuramoyl-L-alanine amidase
MALIVLDAGHGAHDPGAVGPTGLREKDVNLAVALAAGRLLIEAGHDVVQTRDGDTFTRPEERAVFANQRRAAIFVSVHCNAAANRDAGGIETFAFSAGSGGAPLARAIQTRLIAGLGLRDRGVKFESFAVLRMTSMPAALAELAFISNPAEESLLRDPEFQQLAAAAIAGGVMERAGSAVA